jgi:pyridinium-3,5-bisthiocarboxylic acid mononucleotide nickel chelatase
MKIAYLDCFSGISGDMFLACLLDAGLSFDQLSERLHTLPLDGYQLKTERQSRGHIFGTQFTVKLSQKEPAPRNLSAIRELIKKADLEHTIKLKAIELFEMIAGVEAKIHNLPPEEVHFHEVGAVDSIIDIVGAVIGVETLGIKAIYASDIPVGSGFAQTAHGPIPVPAPATIELLKGIPVFDPGITHEMVTPTGAALLKGLCSSFGPMPPMIVKEVGYGVGKRDIPERPNLLRVLIGEDNKDSTVETVVVLETNLDDINPEWMGFLMERLLASGALDVVFFPVQMKKNRPGVQVQVIGRPDQREALIEILFKESTTLGVRFGYTQRQVLERAQAEIDSPWGKIKVKKIIGRDGSAHLQPEYQSCREIALQHNIALKEIYYWVVRLNQYT